MKHARIVAVVRRGAGASAGCTKAESDSALKKGKGINKLEYPVQVAPLELRQVSYTVMAPGSIEAFQQVQITARVAGAVDKVSFAEGAVGQAGGPARRHRAGSLPGGRRSGEGRARRRRGDREGGRGRARAPPAGRRRSTRASSRARRSSSTRRTSRRRRPTSRRRSRRCASRSSTSATRTCARPSPASSSRAPSQAGQYLQPGAILATLLQRDPLLLRFGVTEQDAPAPEGRDDREHEAARERAHVHGEDHPRRRRGGSDDAPRPGDGAGRRHRAQVLAAARAPSARSTSPSATRRQAIVVPSLAVSADGDREHRLHRRRQERRPRQATCSSGCTRPTAASRSPRGSRRASCSSSQGFEALTEGAPVKVEQPHDAAGRAGRVGGAGAPRRHPRRLRRPAPRVDVRAPAGGLAASAACARGARPAHGGTHVNITEVCLRKPGPRLDADVRDDPLRDHRRHAHRHQPVPGRRQPDRHR